MRRFLPILCATLFLASCSSQSGGERGDLMSNPLYVEAIADNAIEYITLAQIHANEIGEPINDPQMLRVIDDTMVKSQKSRNVAREEQKKGKSGYFFGVEGHFAQGSTLLLDNVVYMGYHFEVAAAPDLHVLLSQAVSPDTLDELKAEPYLDLGPLHSTIGAQQYSLPHTLTEDEYNAYRTVLIYSDSFKKVIAMAQIRRSD